MLVMLAIVLTTATFIKVGKIEVNLPSASTSEQAINESGIAIAIDAEGRLFLNEVGTNTSDLDKEISTLSTDTMVTLQVDRGAEFGEFTEVIDVLNKHELKNLSILVKPAPK